MLTDPVDVVIAGGGAVGSAVAWFLSQEPTFQGRIVVVEPDPSYRFAASARSASSIRRQFSTPLNIALSAFGWQFLRALPEVGLTESTYLYLASAAGLAALSAGVAIQQQCGVPAQLHSPAALAQRYPWLNTDDLAGGADTAAGEGWFDGYALVRALRAANEQRGVRYLRQHVAALEGGDDGSVRAVRLADGARLALRWLVLAAGTRSRALAAGAGIDLPVYARKRSVFVFESPAPLGRCPLVVDTTGLWFRPEGRGYIGGTVPPRDVDVAPDDFEVDHEQFEALVWPALSHRVPGFEAVRCTGSWAGHYDYNVFDQNAFLGPCETVPNLLLACGFSGHGLQQAPAVGRALAEYIAFGHYRTLDVTPLSYARFLQGRPLREHHII
jgi:glycine/D-amino acid oxidase-like deaminating enzyme